MHKTSRIDIGKTQYEITSDAEGSLRKYLAALSRVFGADEAKETMADLELHITEILAARNVSAGGRISTEDVLAIKDQLGDPDEVRQGLQEGDVPQAKSRRVVLVGVIGALLVIAGLLVFVWRDRIFTGTVVNVRQSQTYGHAIKSLKTNIESGDITLRPSKANEVVVERYLEWAGKKPTFSEQWNGEELQIKVDCPEEQRNCSVGYVIYVPATISVDVQTAAGNITVQDIVGALRLTTAAGNVEVAGSVGAVWSRVTDGNIAVSGKSSEADLQTGEGSIEVNSNVAPTSVKAITSAGNINIVVPFGDVYAVRAETGSGRRTVGVQYATDAARRIDARTDTGDVTVQYPQN